MISIDEAISSLFTKNNNNNTPSSFTGNCNLSIVINSLGKVWEWLVTTDDRPENMGQIIERK